MGHNGPAVAKQYPLISAVLRRCVASYISGIPNSLKRAGIAQCFHEMARTEYALLAWKKQHEGELPEDLNELAPKIIDRLPFDPFTGKPFDYRIISGGHLLYSPGANQELDGRGEKFSAVFGTGDTDRYRSFFDYDNDDIAMVIIDGAF